MKPKSIASSNSPLLISSAIEVVNTLVYPLMLPPTINATPNSPIALEKQMIMLDSISEVASVTINLNASFSVPPKARVNSQQFSYVVSSVLFSMDIAKGVMRIDCPTIIA